MSEIIPRQAQKRQAAKLFHCCDVAMTTLCRHIYLSAYQRIRNVMTFQHLSNRVGQLSGQHTLRTAAGLTNPRGTPLARPCLHIESCAQLRHSRGLFSSNGLRSLSAVQAQDPDSTQIEADRAGLSDLVASADTKSQQPASATQVQQTFPGVQADAGVEVVSEAIPTEAVLSASVTESNASAAAAAAAAAATNSSSVSSRAPDVPGDWESVFQSFLDVVAKGDFFEGKVPTPQAFSISILKRGVLNFARARQDILFSVPADKIQAVLAAGPPYSERKLTTATKRLSTTFGEQKGFLGQPEGSFQDLTRFIIAAAYSHSMHMGRAGQVKDTDLVDWQTHQYSEDLMIAVTGLMPDVIAAAQREPDAEAVAKAEASALVREQKAITPAASMQTDFRPSNARGAPPNPGERRQDRSRFFMEKGWDGFSDPNTNIKPGDWACAECNQHNFARNQACFKCGAPKTEAAVPALAGGGRRMQDSFSDRRPQTDRFPRNDSFGAAEAMPEGDWDCSECGTNNFARRGKCFKCGRPRAKGMMEGQRPGDWTCPSCSANNFSRRTECFRCQQPKPEDQGYRAQSRRDNFAPSRDRGSFDSRPVYEPKPGDWDCSACGASNFARRGECFKCGEPKSGGGGSGMTTSGRSAGRVFSNKQDESSWFDADASMDSPASSSTSWDPRTSLGSEQSQAFEQNSRGSFDRDTRRGGGSPRGSDWDRGGASMNRGGRGGSSSRGGGSYGSSSRGGSSYGSSSRGGGAPRGRGYSSQSGRGGRGSAGSRDGASFSGYSRGRDIVTGEPIKDSKSRSFSQDSFGGEWGDLE